jgi:hypothetical protein
MPRKHPRLWLTSRLSRHVSRQSRAARPLWISAPSLCLLQGCSVAQAPGVGGWSRELSARHLLPGREPSTFSPQLPSKREAPPCPRPCPSLAAGSSRRTVRRSAARWRWRGASGWIPGWRPSRERRGAPLIPTARGRPNSRGRQRRALRQVGHADVARLREGWGGSACTLRGTWGSHAGASEAVCGA